LGQTGIGKTILITLLSILIDGCIEVINIHPAITTEEIENKILNIMEKHYSNFISNANYKVVIFIDEINVSELVQGLLKSVLIDRKVRHKDIYDFITMVAASNPLEKLTEKQIHLNKINRVGIESG
jgi:MoxR-like ATPase